MWIWCSSNFFEPSGKENYSSLNIFMMYNIVLMENLHLVITVFLIGLEFLMAECEVDSHLFLVFVSDWFSLRK